MPLPSRLVILALVSAAACGPSSPRSASDQKARDVPRTCAIRLPPRTAALPAAPSTGAAQPEPSRAIVHVEMPLARLRDELEHAVPQRVAEVRGEDAGIAGSVDYHADRGPFTSAVEGGALVIRTTIRAKAQLCAKGSCYAGCEPEAIATARVPLALTPEYAFAPSRVEVTFTRACSIKALGGFLTVDVTPMVAARVQPSLRRVEQEIDRRLPAPRPHVDRMWAELSRARPLPLGACALPRPRGIVQGPMAGRGDALVGRFAVVAEPEIRAPCGDAQGPAPPLPPLAHDPGLPEEDALLASMATPLDRAGAALEGDGPIETRARALVKRAVVTPALEGRATFDLELEGEVCGQVALTSALAWAKTGDRIVLSDPALVEGEGARLAAASFDGAALTREVGRVVDLPALLPPSAIEGLVPEISRAASDPSLAVEARVAKAEPRDVAVRDGRLVARVAVKGRVDVRVLGGGAPPGK